jgi:broad specificity phosphatase PhoE
MTDGVRCLFVRHAEKAGIGPGDPGLSPKGRATAASVATYLDRFSPTALLSSPLQRARETAEIIGRVLHLSVRIDPRLRERFNWGDIPGQPFDDFADMFERGSHDRDFAPPGVPTARETGQRMWSVVNDLEVDHGGETIVVVSHGGAIVDMLLNRCDSTYLQSLNPTFADMAFCAVTDVVCCSGRLEIVQFGVSHHE